MTPLHADRVNGNGHPRTAGASARWQLRTTRLTDTAELEQELGLTPLVARILAARGIDHPVQARRFFEPGLSLIHNPFEMDGMEAATRRILRAIESGERICVYGDYDVDGCTATAILCETFRWLQCPVDYHIPHRLNEGYGLSVEGMRLIHQRGAQVVISVDCGITAYDAAECARELGIDLIVTDHHEPGPHDPPAVAVLNPKRERCRYPFKGLSGAGVAFKLAHALLKRSRPESDEAREFLKSLLDLVALGTVADIVPLKGENRSLVTHGLARLRGTRRPGLLQLMDRARLNPARIDTESISFGLAPRLNAAGRTEHATFSVELLLSDDHKHARELARRLDEFNQNRRKIEQGILDEALAIIEAGAETAEWDMNGPVLVVANEGWHLGVLGIVASRLLSRFYKPTIVVTLGEQAGRGSGRSIPGFDLHAALTHCSEHLNQFGGHPMAAGLEVTPRRLAGFARQINEYARSTMPPEAARRLVTLDTEADAAELTLESVGQLAHMEPFGVDNPKPVVSVRDCVLIEQPRVMKERHLRLNVCGPDGRRLTAIGWGMAERFADLAEGTAVSLAGTPFINEWNGRTSVELELADVRVP